MLNKLIQKRPQTFSQGSHFGSKSCSNKTVSNDLKQDYLLHSGQNQSRCCSSASLKRLCDTKCNLGFVHMHRVIFFYTIWPFIYKRTVVKTRALGKLFFRKLCFITEYVYTRKPGFLACSCCSMSSAWHWFVWLYLLKNSDVTDEKKF